MKKQYRYNIDNTGFKRYFYLYHDGELKKSYSIWEDEISDEIDKLEENGYTLGYTICEVEDAKLEYEKMLKNIIKEENF